MDVPWWGAFYLAILCFVPSYADPRCKSGCRGAGGPFIVGNVYKYHLEGSTNTHLPGSPNEVTSLGISATAEVFAESKCQHVLRLSNVEVKGPDGKKYDGLSADCAKPVKFSYDGGKLADVCGEPDDRGTGLNIKRAIISLLSSSKTDGNSENGHETDVFGICPTDFTFSKEGSKLTIHKSRNLNRCALREEFNFPFPTTPYQAAQSSYGAFETSPLLGAQLTVKQELDGGVLQKASGEEVYNYRPLVNPEAGATVKVSYTLTLQGSSPGSIAANVNSPKGIYYQSAHVDGTQNHGAIAEALQKATAALDTIATPEAAKEFGNLVYVIEQGSKSDILNAYSAAEGKTAKNLFLDGLLYAGSADSVEAAAELLSSKQIPEDSAIRWYLDLNFVKHTTQSSLTSLLPLLSGNNVAHQAYLGIGAVAGKFCYEHQQLCNTSPELKALLSKLAEPLTAGCKADSHEKENNIIASLKGLRNARHLTDEVAQKVSACAADKLAKTRVRVAALEAFHADASKSVLKDMAITILKDVEEDSELRIKAYLVLIESPCPKAADTIKHLIDHEPINQVGSYIVSHLRNLRASVSPEKEAAKQFFGNIISKKKYPIDQRKFSRNYEVSYSLDALNVGAVGELNRIFSQKSFIPRSVSLNLTTQLFGHSINLAEIGLRAENLEWHFEKYFGPKGIFKTKGGKILDDFGDNIQETFKKVNEQAESIRPKRSISKQQADTTTNKIQLGPDYQDRTTNLDLSVRLFGSDIAWTNYHYDRVDYNGLKRKFFGKVDESLDKSKSIDIDYKKARTFLDAGVSYPTGLGLGLKVKVNGNSAVNIKFNGNFDIKAILNNPKNAHVAFQVVPSANLELQSLLAVDAEVVEAGVKVSANLHSSTGVDLIVKVLDGFGIDVKLGLPVKKQEILSFHSDIVSVVREKKGAEIESPIKFNVKRQEHGGCFDQLSTLTGLTFCGEVSLPMEGFKMLSPAYGPSKASIRLEKDDESLTAYHFKTFYDNKQPDQISLEVLLDTPNSKTNRKFSLDILGTSKPQKQLVVTLDTPFKHAIFEGQVIDTESEQALSAKLVSDGLEYSFKVGAHVSGSDTLKKYEPLLEYKYPEAAKSEREWIGRKGAVKGGRQQSTLGVTGAVIVERKPGTSNRKYKLQSVTLTTPRLKVAVDGTITIDENLFDTDLKASYDKETLTLSLLAQKLEDNKYIAKIDFLPSQYPDLGGSVKWENEKSPQKIENKIIIVHGPDLKSETSRISITQLLKYKYESIKVFDFYTENTVTYPLFAISAYLKGGATPKSVNYDVDITYDKNKGKSTLDAKIGGKHVTDYSIDFQVQALGNSVDLTSKHERISQTKSKYTNSLEIKPGGKYQLNAVSELNVKPGDIYQSLNVDVKLPQEPKTAQLKTKFKHNSKEDEVEFEVIAGSKHIVDIEYELEKKAEPCGKFKVLLPKYIESEGSFETKADKTSGSFNIDIVKTGRKIEGSGELTRSQAHVKGSGSILWDAKKDQNKKLHVETDTKFDESSLDSKNSLKVLDYQTEVNVKGSINSALDDSALKGDIELVLPNGAIYIAKVDRASHFGSDDNKTEGTWELLQYASKGAQPRQLVLKIAAKNIVPEKGQFDGQVDLAYVTQNKEDIVLHFVGKKIPEGDKWIITGEGSVTGSLVKHPLHTKLSADVAELLLNGHLTADRKFPPANYIFELKAGDDISLVSNGKINQDQLNSEIELHLPADLAIKSLKWNTANTLSIFVPEGAPKKIVTNNVVHWNGDKFVKFSLDSDVITDKNKGKITWENHVYSARTLTYSISVDEKRENADLGLIFQWEDKTADINIKVDRSNPIHINIVSNVPNHGLFQIDLSHKDKDGGEAGETLISATGNGKKWVYSSDYSRNRIAPHIDVNLDIPQGKYRYYIKLEKKEEQHVLAEGKFNWPEGGSLDLNSELNVKNLDEFYLKVLLDSPKLNINKFNFEADNHPTKSASKKISFRGKSGEKDISGSITLVSKGSSPNIHYEGHGALKVGENSYPLEFKYIYDPKQLEVYAEIKDVQRSYNAHLLGVYDDVEPSAKLVAEHNYCKDNQCKGDKISLHRKGSTDYEAGSEIKLDLLVHSVLVNPILIKSHHIKEGWQYDNNYEVESGESKLQYHEYIKDNHAGIELTLPQRIIAAEVSYDLPSSKKPTYFKVEANVWLDKKNAVSEKTSLLLHSEATKLPDGISSLFEAHFNTPGLKDLSLKGDWSVSTKDRMINGKIEADVFAKKNQKLVAEYKASGKKEKEGYSANDKLHVFSKGLNIEAQLERKLTVTKTSYSHIATGFYIDSKQVKREAIAKLVFDRKSFIALVKLPEGTLYSEELMIEDKGNKEFHLKGQYEILGLKFEEKLEIKGTRGKIILNQKGVLGNNALWDLEFGFTPGQLAEIQSRFNKNSLVKFEVALDEAHFLKSKYSYDTNVAKDFVKHNKDSIVAMVKEASRITKESGAKLANEVTERIDDCRKALPNFKPAQQYFQKELQEMKEALLSNQNVKDAVHSLKETFGPIITQINAILSEITSTIEHLISLLNETLQKITESFKAVIPKLKESYEKASDIVIGLFEDLLKHVTSVINVVLDKIKEHEKEIEELTNVVTDFLHDVSQLVAVSVGEVQKQINDFVSVLWDQIQALPAYTMLKDKLQELKNFKIPEQYWEEFHQVVKTIEQVLPTLELQQLLKTAADLIEKIIRQQPINRSEVIDQLVKDFTAALRSLIAIIEVHKPEDKTGLHANILFPVPSVALIAAPPGTFRFSLFNWIRSPDLPSISEIYHSYRPKHNPLDFIPPFLASATLLGGTEFYTFDKKHFSFKGSCSYILSTDAIDGNFTLVANMEAGKLKSIAVFDHENNVELLNDDSVTVNGNPADLPVHIGELNLWRKFGEGTGFSSDMGLMFFCTSHLKTCAFTVDGFYFGKTRGLLGTYNNEPHDDAIVPEGKNAKSLTEFANSWKVNPQCPDGVVHEQAAPPSEECTKLFSGDSNLRACFAYENPEAFRESCNKQVAEASGEAREEKSCQVALSYVAYCYYIHFVKINLPDHCGKCQVGSQSLHIGESAPVKVPQKEADVIFVVQQLEDNEEVFKNLITPLVSTLTNDFKEKGITDINYSLIGYGAPEQKWPSIYTFNGKFNEFSGTAKNIYFAKAAEGNETKLSDKLHEVKKHIQLESGFSKAAMAFKEAFSYPFRPEAVKTVVAVMSSSEGCERAVLPFQSLRLILHRLNLLDSGIEVNLVTPLHDLKIEGKDEKTAANIVGFDSYSVYTQSEAKRKVLKGDEDAFKNLKYSSDVCVDLALGVDGAVFSSTNFIKGKPNLRKNFIQVLSNKITESLTSEELKKECKCELVRGMVVRTKCKIISRKEKEAYTKGGVKGGGVKG